MESNSSGWVGEGISLSMTSTGLSQLSHRISKKLWREYQNVRSLQEFKIKNNPKRCQSTSYSTKTNWKACRRPIANTKKYKESRSTRFLKKNSKKCSLSQKLSQPGGTSATIALSWTCTIYKGKNVNNLEQYGIRTKPYPKFMSIRTNQVHSHAEFSSLMGSLSLLIRFISL